jgi:hypothetical protein
MRTRQLAAPAIALLSLLLVVGACGGGGDDDKDSKASSSSSITIGGIDDDAINEAADAAGIDQDCVAVALEFQQAFGDAATAMGSPDSLGDYAKTFTDLGKRLPDLKDEFNTIGQAFKDAGDGNFAALDDAAYKAAGQKVSTYFQEHCQK